MSSTMSFGKRERIRFVAAGKLKDWRPSCGPAVYAITYQQDPEQRPKSHTVLYFGEAQDLTKQAQSISSDITQWWSDHGGKDEDLYMFFHEMPGSSSITRTQVQHQLVMEYDPQANT